MPDADERAREVVKKAEDSALFAAAVKLADHLLDESEPMKYECCFTLREEYRMALARFRAAAGGDDGTPAEPDDGAGERLVKALGYDPIGDAERSVAQHYAGERCGPHCAACEKLPCECVTKCPDPLCVEGRVPKTRPGVAGGSVGSKPCPQCGAGKDDGAGEGCACACHHDGEFGGACANCMTRACQPATCWKCRGTGRVFASPGYPVDPRQPAFIPTKPCPACGGKEGE